MLKFTTALLLSNVSAAARTAYGDLTYDMAIIDDNGEKKMQLTVNNVPENTWFAITYHGGMEKADGVAFFAKPDGQNDEIKDTWSTGFQAPTFDGQNDYDPQSSTSKADKKSSYVTKRKLDTGDAQDFKIECGKDYPKWSWVARTTDSNWVQHDKDGHFGFKTDANCQGGLYEYKKAVSKSAVTLAASVATGAAMLATMM